MRDGRITILSAVVLATSMCSHAMAVDSTKGSREKAKPASAGKPTQKVTPTHTDEKYGPHEKQAFDLYLVESNKPTPLFIWIHGGGFQGGDKRPINEAMLQRFARH